MTALEIFHENYPTGTQEEYIAWLENKVNNTFSGNIKGENEGEKLLGDFFIYDKQQLDKNEVLMIGEYAYIKKDKCMNLMQEFYLQHKNDDLN